MAADWSELMVPQRIMRSSRADELLDPTVQLADISAQPAPLRLCHISHAVGELLLILSRRG